MEQKTYTAPLELKADGKPGEFRAVFATFDVNDLHGDWTTPGAFRDGQETVIEQWNHGYELPAGKGVIVSDDKEAWIDGAFFLDTEVGNETYKTVKNLGGVAEWSYTFDILQATPIDPKEYDGADRMLNELDVVGVAPVTRGAGINTRTTAIKSQDQKRAIAPRTTPTTDAAWDGPANEARLRNDGDSAYYRRAYAWVDPDGDPNVKSSYKFIHHMVSGDGTIGAANVRACSTGIGVLNGGRGGTTIPTSDRQGVYNHLARHLRDAEMEPPELKTKSTGQTDSSDPDESSAQGGADGQGGNASPNADLDARINLTEIQTIITRNGVES